MSPWTLKISAAGLYSTVYVCVFPIVTAGPAKTQGEPQKCILQAFPDPMVDLIRHVKNLADPDLFI